MQQVLYWDEDILARDILSEKVFKVMRYKQAGFPVPNFFTIVSDGSGKLTIDDAVETAFHSLQTPLIGRSAHPMEGNPHPFSGRHKSFPRIDRLVDTDSDMGNYTDPTEFWESYPEGTDMDAVWDHWWATRTLSLERSYADMVANADPDGKESGCYKVRDYLEHFGIEGYDHRAMNMLVMEEKPLDIFAMFLTSEQDEPHILEIHYQDKRTKEGDVVRYNKQTGKIEGDVSEDLTPILTEFATLAQRVEAFEGKMQMVEMGSGQGQTWLFQSRDIDLGDPNDAPCYSNYKSFSKDLHAKGYGDYHLPIVVIDSPSAVFGTSLVDKETLEAHRREIVETSSGLGEYIVIVKDAESFLTNRMPAMGDRDKDDYYDDFFKVTEGARIMIKGKNQYAVRHDDWELIELGGMIVTVPGGEEMMGYFIYSDTVPEEARFHAGSYADRGAPGGGGYAPNISTVRVPDCSLKTGDKLHVLSNTDGCFIWTDDAKSYTPLFSRR